MIPDPDPMEFPQPAEAVRATPSQTRTADQIVTYARQQLYADHAGITLIRARKLHTVPPPMGW